MTTDEATQKLKDLQNSGDPEYAHPEADDVLCELLKSHGCAEVVAEFEKIKKWYA